jgi:hypothetical protein
VRLPQHLSYNWHDARWMYDNAKRLGAPFMAGSSLVSCYRNPPLEHDLESEIEESLAVGFSGCAQRPRGSDPARCSRQRLTAGRRLDIYAAHTLEVLQCMVERRKGGESGVVAVCTLCAH